MERKWTRKNPRHAVSLLPLSIAEIIVHLTKTKDAIERPGSAIADGS